MTIDDETAERIVEKVKYIRDCLEILAQEQSLTKGTISLIGRRRISLSDGSRQQSKRVLILPVGFSAAQQCPVASYQKLSAGT